MYKRLEFYPEDRNGVEVELIHPGVLTKTAEMSDELHQFLKELKIEPKRVYVLVNALSAGEYYGANRNGDFISEDVLEKYHKYFEERGHVYKHHRNKNPLKSLGKILFSHYNKGMHRVELVCELNENKDEKFINYILAGKHPAVSMGMKTPYDVCSYCGHRSKSLAQYCKHLKHEMNKVYPDGRKVYAINPAAKFFDISFVVIAADPTAGVMKKLASAETHIKSGAELGKEFLQIAGLKEADLTKKIETPVKVKKILKDTKGHIYLSQPAISKEDVRALVKDASAGEVLSTMLGMRIMPKPIDFQRIVLYSKGHEKVADSLEKKGISLINVTKKTTPIIPEDISLVNFNDKLAKKFAHLMPERSLTKPLVTARIIEKVAFMSETPMEEAGAIPPKKHPSMDPDKEASEFFLKKEPSYIRKILLGTTEDAKVFPYKNPIIASSALSGLFYGLQKAHNAISGPLGVGQFDAFLLRRPWLIPLLIGGTSLASMKAQAALHKTASSLSLAANPITKYLVVVPTTYFYAGRQESKVRKGQQIGPIQNLIRKHPLLTSVIGGAGLGRLGSLMKVSSRRDNLVKVVSRLSPEKLDAVFNDVIKL